MSQPATDPISIGAALARVAAQKPDAPAVTCEGTTVTWRELHTRTNRMARGMAKKGVKFGDFLTIALPNGVAFVEACYAAWKLGAVPQPVSSRLPLAELNAHRRTGRDARSSSAMCRSTASGPSSSSNELLEASSDDSDLPDRIVAVLESADLRRLDGTAEADRVGYARSGRRPIASLLADPARRRRADARPALSQRSFRHGLRGLQIGAPVVLMPKFDAEATLRDAEHNRATWVYLVPTMMSRIWRLPEDVRAQVRCLVAEDRLASGSALPRLAEGRMDRLARRQK